MNLAEHPQALDLQKRLSTAEVHEGQPPCIPVVMFMPGVGKIQGALRAGNTPGIFILSSNVQIEGTSQAGVMEFSFTADQPFMIIHPDLTQEEGKSRIIQ